MITLLVAIASFYVGWRWGDDAWVWLLDKYNNVAAKIRNRLDWWK